MDNIILKLTKKKFNTVKESGTSYFNRKVTKYKKDPKLLNFTGTISPGYGAENAT